MKLLTSLFIDLMSTSAFADDNYDLTGRWGLGLGLGTSKISGPSDFKEGASELDSKFAASLWMRYHLTSRFGLELAYSHLKFGYARNTAPQSDMDPLANILDLSLAYRIFPTARYHVLLQAGVGRSEERRVGKKC